MLIRGQATVQGGGCWVLGPEQPKGARATLRGTATDGRHRTGNRSPPPAGGETMQTGTDPVVRSLGDHRGGDRVVVSEVSGPLVEPAGARPTGASELVGGGPFAE